MNEEQKSHMAKLISTDNRIDARKRLDYRKIEIETGIIETAEGSARDKFGETEVLVGVKLSVEKPFPDTPEDGILMVGAELLPLSNPKYESGPPSVASIEMSRVIDRSIRESKCIDTKNLCIEKGEKVWTINVDICPLNDDGNLLDAGALASMAALLNTTFPEYDGKNVNYKGKTDKKLPIRGLPITITVLKMRDNFFVDANEMEEELIESRLTVASLDKNTLCALQKGGDSSLKVADIEKMIEIGLEKGDELRKLLR